MPYRNIAKYFGFISSLEADSQTCQSMPKREHWSVIAGQLYSAIAESRPAKLLGMSAILSLRTYPVKQIKPETR